MGFAEKHLLEAQRIEIARELFKTKGKPTAKGELNGLCPFHEETHPSFSYNFKTDKYNCFSCGASGDLIKLWARGHCPGANNEKHAFKAFCDTFDCHDGAIRNPEKDEEAHARAKVTEQMKKAWALFLPLPEAMIKKLEKSRGWSREVIQKLNLRLETHRLNKDGQLEEVQRRVKIAIPIFDTAGELVNIRLYQPGAKQFKIISFGKGVGLSRLFRSPVKDDVSNGASPIILCEGESDTICAYSHGLNAITQTSKLVDWPKQHKAVFAGRDVYIAYDADVPGQKYAAHAAQALQGVAKSIRMVQWPAFMMEGGAEGKIAAKHGQDLTDFFVRHGKTADDFAELLKSAPLYDPANDPYASAGSATATAGGDAPAASDFFAPGVRPRISFRPRLLAERLQTDMRLLYHPGTGLLYKWTGKFWDLYDDTHIRKIAIENLGNESQKSRIEDAVYQVKALSTIPYGRELNDRDDWICIQNGLLNVATFEMKAHDPDYLNTYMLPVSLDPESKKRCERFEKYLLETVQTPGPIAQVQEFAGYCLVRHTKYEKCLVLLGPGEDGKSTLLKILRAMVGAENCAAVSFADLENEFHRSSLYHRVLNISTEIGAAAMESPIFKAITSGDPINGAFKCKDVFEFRPYCKLAFAGPSLPRVRDNSHGFFRRFLPVQFKRQFREGDPARDPDLFDKLLEELPEIFYWALCGLKRLVDQKMFTTCDETKELMMSYRRSNNPVLCFVEDECTLDGDVAKDTLYESYRDYCKKYGYMALNKDNFFRELYTAISNLQLYRPSVNGVREYRVKGITLGVDIAPSEEGK